MDEPHSENPHRLLASLRAGVVVDGKYRVDVARMRAASDSLSRRILMLQGDGDYAGVGALYSEFGKIDASLQADLDRLKAKGIPVDIIYEQER